MIQCDSCEEWFHGECVGIAPKNDLKNTQYNCIACARRKFYFNPAYPYMKSNNEENKSDLSGLNEKIDPSNYTAFFSVGRPTIEQFEQIL